MLRSLKTLFNFSSKNKKNVQFGFTKGGLSSVPIESIRNYCLRLKKNKASKWHQQVLNFKQTILNDPVLRMCFNDEVLQRQQLHSDGRLLGDSFDGAMEMINTAISTPPSF